MKKQIVKIIHNGIYKVIFDDSTKNNPYTIYKETYTADGRCHTKTLVRYQDFASCMYYLTEEIIKH